MKRKLAILLTMTIVFSLLGGCGAKDSNDDGSKTKKVELDVMMSFPQYTDQVETYFDKFKEKMLEENNTEVTINLEMPSSEQYGQILQTRLSSNEAPDLFTIHALADIPTYYNGGYLKDLSDQPFASKIYDDVKQTVTYDGKVLAVPLESTAWGYLYNKDIFDECNITPPETIDEMKEDCEILKAKGYTPFLLSFQDSWIPQLMTALSLGGVVSGSETDWLNKMYEDNGSYSDVSEIFDIIDIINKNGTDRPFETGYDKGCAEFANGNAAMWVNGTWAAEPIISANEDINIGVGALPVNNDPKSTLINLSTSTSLVVYSGTEKEEMALELANYILDDNDSSDFYQSMKFNPVATCHNYEQYSWVKDAYKYVEEGRAYTDLVIPSAVTDEQAKLLQEYYIGSVTKKDMIDTLDKTFKEANKASAEANEE